MSRAILRTLLVVVLLSISSGLYAQNGIPDECEQYPTIACQPSPLVGASAVPDANLVLTWINPDPRQPGDTITSYVWFSADDPNMDDPVLMDSGEDMDSVTISLPEDELVYYWQVNCEDPNTGGTPILMEGNIWNFSTVLHPASVDAGIDMITWSGEPVQLDPTTVNSNPPTVLTYAWTADPNTGVVFSATDVKAPTVTITKPTDNPSVVTLTLAINNEGQGQADIEDAMTINVYDDSCQARRIGLGQAANHPTDITGDCMTSLEDFAEMVTVWLVNYDTLTAPVPKP